MRRITAFLAGILFTAVNLPLILAINFLQMLTTPLFLFSHPFARSVNERLAFLWSATFDIGLRYLLRVPVTFTGDKPVPGENAFLIANHQCMADIPVITLLVQNGKMLPFIKWFVKDPIKYSPGVGWGMLFLDCVFLKRDWAKDKKTIDRTFARLRHPSARFWLISFPEGTRKTSAKLAKAKEYAKMRGLPVPEYTLVPKPRGFAAAMLGLGEKLGAVYDLTIKFSGDAPSFLGFFFTPQAPIEVLVKRFPVAQIPATETAQAEWVKQRFQEKDQFLRRP